jgi:hypothetical protein
LYIFNFLLILKNAGKKRDRPDDNWSSDERQAGASLIDLHSGSISPPHTSLSSSYSTATAGSPGDDTAASSRK